MIGERTIRRARESDIPDVLRLLTQVNMVHHNARPDLFRGPATKYSAAELAVIFNSGSDPVFVCCGADGAVLGYAFCMVKQHIGSQLMTDVKTLYIDDLCVDEAIRGKGVGGALYEHCVAYAREIGCHNLTLNVWTCNPQALRFYEKCGLEPQKICMETVLR